MNSENSGAFSNGDDIVLSESSTGVAQAFELLTYPPEDFLADGRIDTPPQDREGL